MNWDVDRGIGYSSLDLIASEFSYNELIVCVVSVSQSIVPEVARRRGPASSPVGRDEAIMLQNSPIVLFNTSQKHTPLCFENVL